MKLFDYLKGMKFEGMKFEILKFGV